MDESLEGQIAAVWKRIESLRESCGGRLGPPVLVAQEVALLRSRIDEARAEGDTVRLQRCLVASKLLHARFQLLVRLGTQEEQGVR